MANKKINRNGIINLIIVLVGIIGVLGLAGVVAEGQSDESLQAELDNLSSELTSEGYDWLVNYFINNTASIEVYREDGEEVIAVISNISERGWYKTYLDGSSGSGLNDSESLDVFDLKIVCQENMSCLGIEFDYIVDPYYMNESGKNLTYENVSDVYHGFLWDKNNIWMQVRSCDDADCSGETFVGPDNTSATWFENFGYNRLNVTLTPKNQYFQYKAFLYRNVSGRVNETFSPKLSNVTIGYYNYSSPYVESPNLTYSSAGDTLFNCSTRGYTMGSEVNVSFKWYVGDSLFKEEVLNLSSESLVSSVVENPVYGKWFNCTVYAYDGNYSVNRTDRIFNRVYKTVYQVYHGFESFGNNILMQVRSCDDADCSGESFVGPDNTSATWFDNPTKGNLTNVTENRYFQYFAYIFRNASFDQDYSPVLWNVSIYHDTTNCSTLNQANTVYNLTGNIVQENDANCMVVTAQNVVLDCAGYSITSVYNVSGVYSNQFNTTVKNCNVSMGSGGNTEAIGIEMTNSADNSRVVNNTIWGDMGRGIDFASGNNGPESSLIEDNNVNLTDSNGAGIYLRNSNNNNLTGNNLTIDGGTAINLYDSDNNILDNNVGIGTAGYAIYLNLANNNILTNNKGTAPSYYGVFLNSAYNNTLTNNTWKSSTKYGIYLYRSSYNEINLMNATGTYGIYLEEVGYTNFTDCVDVSGTTADVYVKTDGSTNNTVFLNCSYDVETNAGDDDWIVRKWYYRSYVNDSDGNPILNANVTAFNVSDDYQFNYSTDATGYTSRTEITEYVNLGGTRNYYNNYNITAVKTGYSLVSHDYNVSLNENNLEDNLEMNASEGASQVDYCGTLGTAGLVYTLGSNVSSTGTCFTVTNENITIDCAGYEINYSYAGTVGYGVYSNQFNTSVRGCVVVEGESGTANKYGIYFNGADNGIIESNNITIIGSSYGVYIFNGADNNILSNNTLVGLGASSLGVVLNASSNNNFNGNNFTTSGSDGYGLYIGDDSYDNYFSDENIMTSGGSAFGIYINEDITNTTIIDSVINATSAKDIYVDTDIDPNSWLKLINVTFNKSDVSINNESFLLDVQWYLDIHVNSSSGLDIDGAEVSVDYVNGTEAFNDISNALGLISQRNMTEYNQNITGRFFVTNYSITSLASNYNPVTYSLNLTESTVYDVIMVSSDYNRSSLGLNTSKIYINYNELVNLTITIPDENLGSKVLSAVWAEITEVDGSKENVSLYNESCYDNETEIFVLEEVDCGSEKGYDYVEIDGELLSLDKFEYTITRPEGEFELVEINNEIDELKTHPPALNNNYENKNIESLTQDRLGDVRLVEVYVDEVGVDEYGNIINEDGNIINYGNIESVTQDRLGDVGESGGEIGEIGEIGVVSSLDSRKRSGDEQTGEVEQDKERADLLDLEDNDVDDGILDFESLFVDSVMMVKVFKNNSVVFESENKDKMVYLNSFEITQVIPKIFEMVDSSSITTDNLFNFFVDSNGEIFIFPFEFVENFSQFRRNLKVEGHFNPINLSNFSTVIGMCGPSSIFLNFSTYSSFNSSSSIGYQSILSQNSWSSSERVPVLVNLSDISCFINFINTSPSNLEADLVFNSRGSDMVSSDIFDSGDSKDNDYLSFLVVNIDDKGIDNLMQDRLDGSDEQDEEIADLLDLGDNDINNIGNEKENATEVASMVMHLSQVSYFKNNNNYINLSLNKKNKKGNQVPQGLEHLSNKQGLHRLPGSNPNSSPDFLFDNQDTKVKTLGQGASTLSEVKCYKQKWKYFYELEDDDRVMTLNQESGESEWQVPTKRQVFDNSKLSGEMYNIKTVDSEGKEGELVVSEKHRVYVGNVGNVGNVGKVRKINEDYKPISFLNCSVVTTEILPFNISLNSSSLDQILISIPDDLYLRASAVYGKSSGGLYSLACSSNFSYSCLGTGDILLSVQNNMYHNLESCNLEYLSNFSSFLLNSSKIYSGVTNSYPLFFNNLINSNVYPLLINEANMTCASTINNFIFYKCFLATAELTSLPSSIACSSVNSLSSNRSLAMENSTSSCICSTNLFNTSFALSSNPFGTSNLKVSSVIVNNNDSLEYINVSDFKLIKISDIYFEIEKGELKAEDLVFLDGESNEVEVLDIEIVDYSGMIYDVDVENDIVLVKRDGLVVWSGNSNVWNATWDHSGVLGDYNVEFNANLTDGSILMGPVVSNFTVQNTTISISLGGGNLNVNTTDSINVNGVINRWNGTDSWAIDNNLFLIKLNEVTVSSNIYNDSDFDSGAGDGNVNVSVGDLRLNLTNEGDVISYSDDYVSCTKYIADNYSSYNTGCIGGVVFDGGKMVGSYGNITYKFTSPTKFYNASAYLDTGSAEVSGGNISLWYSYDYISWSIIDSTTSFSDSIGDVFDVDGYTEFYVKIEADISSGENPVEDIEINYTNYQYPSLGIFNSTNINLPNVTYTVLKWSENLSGSGGDIKIQLRESDDGSSWDAWSSNYSNYLNNDISSFTKPYIQYRALLETSNGNLTPVLYSVNISYFNASTNSTGGYNYSVEIPVDNLGVQALEVSVVQNSVTGILGSNSTSITVWARTDVPYSTIKNYTESESNYSVWVNFTRTDTGGFINGSVNVSISNSSYMLSEICSGVSQCVVSWDVPSDLSYGNYTVNVSGYNESGYYINSSAGFYDYLEEKNTTGTLKVNNKTIGDYSFGSLYSFLWNAEINNTGKASMNDVYVYVATSELGTKLNITQHTPCSRIYPEQDCNAVLNITLGTNVAPKEAGYWVTLRANWSDNDGGVAGGGGYIQADPTMYIIVVGNATLELNNYSVNLSMQHESDSNFSFAAMSTGSNTVFTISTSFLQGNITGNSNNISSSWISVPSTNPITSIPAGEQENITINISVPVQTSPGNYTGRINVSAVAGGEKLLDLGIEVLENGSWHLSSDANTNFTYNRTFSLSTAGEIGNFTIVNIGNINLTMNLTYSPKGECSVGAGAPPWDYTCFPGLFSINNVDGSNPGSVNITKGENTTFSVRHNGNLALEKIDIRVVIGLYNASANPIQDYIEDAWSIEEQAPNVTNIWFYYENVNGSVAEQNANLTIKVKATDDVALNLSGATLNISWSGGASKTSVNLSDLSSTSGEYELSGSDYIVMNYTANYTPTTGGASGAVYNVIARVLDNTGKEIVSSEYSFTSYGTTTIELSQNYSEANVSNVDLNNKGIVYVNFTINNTGYVRGYNPELGFVKNESMVISNYSFSNISTDSKLSYVAQINVSELTAQGSYNVSAILTWTNPNTGTSSDSVVFVINVAENKSMVTNPLNTITTSLGSGSSNSSILEINNTGNTLLSEMNLDCYTGTLCSSITIGYNESDFNIAKNSSRLINISLTASAGLAADTYIGTINISESNISKTIDIQAVVPETKTWTISDTSLNVTKGSDTSGDLQLITINNTGNIDMTFNLASSNTSLFDVNQSSIDVSLATSRQFTINYSAPHEEGEYIGVINITNTDAGANPVQRNITINMTVTSMGIDILSPTEVSPLTNVTAGQNIETHVDLTYQGSDLTSNAIWNIVIGGSNCTSVNSSYDSGLGYWNITCNAPSIADGRDYNLTAIATHDTYGERQDKEDNAISYLDISAPSFAVIRNHINSGSNINLQVNVSDNVGISDVWFELTYPNASVYNMSNSTKISMSLSGGYYINNSFALSDVGEYLVNYSANDTTGNFNSTLDWFEVLDRYNWVVKLLDYRNTAVANVNISLYRPSSIFLMSNTTNASGDAELFVNKRFYDMNVLITDDRVIVRNVNFSNWSQSNMSFNLDSINAEELSEIVTLYKSFIGIASNSTGLDDNNVEVSFNYSGQNYDNPTLLSIVKCSNWDYANRTCSGGWSAVSSSRNIDNTSISGNSTGFSTYFLAESKCGNGLCETTYGETSSNCAADCVTAQGGTTVVSSGGGGGGGGGGGISSTDLSKIEEMIKSFLNIGGVKLETTSIYKELFAGDTTSFRIHLRNTVNSEKTISMEADGDIKEMLFFESSSITLEPKEERDVLIKIIAPKTAEPGNYDGDLVLKSGEEEGKIPVTIRILSPEGKLLDVKIQPLSPTVRPGGVLRLQTDLLNLGKTKKIDVQFDLQLLYPDTGELVTRTEEAFAVETSMSVVKNLTIPENTPVGNYMVKAVAYYSNNEVDGTMQASSIAYVNVQYPFFMRKLFGIPVWLIFIIIAIIGMVIGGIFYLRWLEYKAKRFKTKLEFNKLPHPGPSSGFVGKIAETDVRAFSDLNKLQMHTLVAGATGGGKTVAAQGIIEEALVHKKSVIVFDPTAQWTGFLRKCEDKGMLKRYKYFDMKKGNAKSFNGSIKTIHDPYELINIKKYLNKPGEITIFNVSHLTPKEIDVVVASTIEQIFKSEPEESSTLKTLIVYDEVHRLLPKFGGSGQGFVQLERGAREFRKWGIGLVLISQVLSDFVGEVKANIGTEIQMGTRYEGDLERVSMKYGEDVLKSVVKEPIGTGMVTNAEFNSGRPYFIAFRPLLHSTKRLTNDELKKYEKYFEEIEDLEYQSFQLKKLGVDVFDLKLEIKLSKDKVKQGQFQMADMYLESLRPKVEEQWSKLGKKPMHLVKKRMRKEEVMAGISIAKQEREKIIKKEKQKGEGVSFDKELIDIRKLLEEKKKKGAKTSDVEMKLSSLKDRLKPFKGKKIPAKDAKGVRQEIDGLNKMIGKL